MSETERRTIPGFPHEITRDGRIYSPGGKELYRPDDVENSRVELRLPGDGIGKICDVASLVRKAGFKNA